MLPSSIDNTKYKYIKVDEKYIVSIIIKSLPEYIFFLDVIKDIDKNIQYDMSIYLNKLDPIKTLNQITYNISSNQSELRTINKNLRNIDIINKSNEEAKSLRRKIQIENQEIYNITIIFSFYSYQLDMLLKSVSYFRAKLYSREISADITNFRHLEFYLSNLPLCIRNEFFINKLYLTTNAVANIFPFFNETFVDKNGISIGYTKNGNRICAIDIFSNKYENSNICIFGSSGSGKSFFTKLFILRHFFTSKVQIVFDVENEYEKLCKSLGGQIVFRDNYYNILQIRKNEIQNDFLNKKINKVLKLLMCIGNFNVEQEEILKSTLIKLYENFNITNDINTIIKKNYEDEMSLDYEIIDNENFPTLQDLYEKIDDVEIKEKIYTIIHNELKFFSGKTNIDENNRLFVINTSQIIKYEKVVSWIIQGILNSYLGEKETIIYIDEIWKYIMSDVVLDSIFNMYKTIRKRKASIVSITQDITDFFKYKNGYYANSILNNSCFKIIFKTEFKDIDIFSSISNIPEDKISYLKKGEAYLMVNNNSVCLNILANDYERELLDEVTSST